MIIYYFIFSGKTPDREWEEYIFLSRVYMLDGYPVVRSELPSSLPTAQRNATFAKPFGPSLAACEKRKRFNGITDGDQIHFDEDFARFFEKRNEM